MTMMRGARGPAPRLSALSVRLLAGHDARDLHRRGVVAGCGVGSAAVCIGLPGLKGVVAHTVDDQAQVPRVNLHELDRGKARTRVTQTGDVRFGAGEIVAPLIGETTQHVAGTTPDLQHARTRLVPEIAAELTDHMTEDAADETLTTVIGWARYAELFSYDDDAAMFSLENPI